MAAYPNKIILGLDARGGVATEGWDKDAGITALEFVRDRLGCPWQALFVRAVDRDGICRPKRRRHVALAKAARLPVLIWCQAADLRLKTVCSKSRFLMGAITGRAIYEELGCCR